MGNAESESQHLELPAEARPDRVGIQQSMDGPNSLSEYQAIHFRGNGSESCMLRRYRGSLMFEPFVRGEA